MRGGGPGQRVYDQRVHHGGGGGRGRGCGGRGPARHAESVLAGPGHQRGRARTLPEPAALPPRLAQLGLLLGEAGVEAGPGVLAGRRPRVLLRR